MSRKRTILFIGEAVSLAHVARPLVLAQSLDPANFGLHFACDPRYQNILRLPSHIRFWPISSSHSDSFTKGSDRGGFVWQPDAIESFVREELELFDQVHPDLIVADFRFSVSISAELRKITYVTLTNTHWSPFRKLDFNPVPHWPLSVRLRQKFAKIFLPWKKGGVTLAMNAVRQRRGLPLLKGFLDLTTRGSYTLYAEPEGFVPTNPLPDHHRFLGPVLWSPDVPKPAWWQAWPANLPIIYLTLGSTGAAKRLPEILEGLRDIAAVIIVATAGRVRLPQVPPNVFVADYLPGLEVCRLASVVVCNGGSATAYQALSQGAPVIGVWSNLDQYLTAMTIERTGAGLCCRASDHDARMIHQLTTKVLGDPSFRTSAVAVAEKFRAFDAGRRFDAFVQEVAKTIT